MKKKRAPLSPKNTNGDKKYVDLESTRFQKTSNLIVNVNDANRAPKSIELAIRGSYGLLISKPKRFQHDEFGNRNDENDDASVRSLSSLPAWADKTDVVVQQAALNHLRLFHNHSAAIIIQHAYRSWTSKQMCKAWVDFNSMHAVNEHKSEYASNLFQARLAERAYIRLQKRQLKLFFSCWSVYTKSFKRIRERILVCYFASKMSTKIVGWRRVVMRQMALKRVVYYQERLVRRRHYNLWWGLTLIKRNMLWCMRRALNAIKNYMAGNVSKNRDRWEYIVYGCKRWMCSLRIQTWYRCRSVRAWYLLYVKSAKRVKDEIIRRLGGEVRNAREAIEIDRLSRERAMMKKISRRAVGALREYITTDEGEDAFSIYWRVVRNHRRAEWKKEKR